MHGENEDHGAAHDARVNDRIDGGDGAGEPTLEIVPGMEMVQVPLASGNQLTLSFQGEVYVFHSVQPEKVQAVLLLLGGQELPTDSSGALASSLLNRNGMEDTTRSSNSHRVEALMRYREKRKSLCFAKKVVYEVRSEVASRMKRHKGQFASSKSNPVEAVASCAADPVNSSPEVAPFPNCQNCGISKDATPMMRKGPGGPKSLCNACGLMWATKKTLKSAQQLPQASEHPIPVINQNVQSEGSDSDIDPNSQMETAYSNHPSILTAEICHGTKF